eukprot:7720453-Heterocapsa_arctica.AAC.1
MVVEEEEEPSDGPPMKIFVTFDTREPREHVELVVSCEYTIAELKAHIEVQEGIVIDLMSFCE